MDRQLALAVAATLHLATTHDILATMDLGHHSKDRSADLVSAGGPEGNRRGLLSSLCRPWCLSSRASDIGPACTGCIT